MLQCLTKKSLLLAGIAIAGMFAFSLEAQDSSGKELSGRAKRYAEFSQLPDENVIKEIDREKLKNLSRKKVALMVKMHAVRMELIKKDQRLAALRRKILTLSLELSQELNAKQEMLALNNELAALEDEIKEIVKNTKKSSRTKKY
ncbi:MAG: hypothetical protein J6S53_08645 [Lentisphaeria bacterium]|nr:hypothetical protein [Lentisphaeria bacterium]